MSETRPRYLLVQARNEGDPARMDEQRCFAARLAVPVESLRCVDIFTTPLRSALLQTVDAVLVGGAGQYSVLDDLDPIRRFVDFTAETALSGKPMFASCFGYQALVVGLGGTVVSDPDNAEVGTYMLTRDTAADQDPVFGPLPDRFRAQLGHKDRASVLPAEVVNLASSERAPFQALWVRGSQTYGTQFHPELLWSDNRKRFVRYMAEYGALFGEEQARERLESHKPGPEANTLLPRFAEVCLGDSAPLAAVSA